MATYLDKILDRHREVAAADRRPLDALVAEAKACPPTRGFRAALVGGDLHDQPLAGGVFALDAGVQGLPETAWRG